MKYLIKCLPFCFLIMLIGCDSPTGADATATGDPSVVQKTGAKVQSTNVARYTAVPKGDGEFKKGEFDNTHLTQVTYFKTSGATDKKYWYSKSRKIVNQMKVSQSWKGLDSFAVIKNDKMAVKKKLAYKLNEKGQKIATAYYDPKFKLIKTHTFGYNNNQDLIQETERDPAGNILLTTTYVYNQAREQIGMKSINSKGKVVSEEKYEITKRDKNGNWIRKYVYTNGKVSHLINRQLGYFD